MSEKGMATPLDVKPIVSPHDYNWYVYALDRLHASRQISEVICRIPFSEYVSYFQVYEPLDSVQEDIDVLMEMDRIYVKINNEKLRQERDLKKHETRPKGKR